MCFSTSAMKSSIVECCCQRSESPKPSAKSASAVVAKLGPMSGEAMPKAPVAVRQALPDDCARGSCPDPRRRPRGSEATKHVGITRGHNGERHRRACCRSGRWRWCSDSAMLNAKTSTSESPASVALAVSRLEAGLRLAVGHEDQDPPLAARTIEEGRPLGQPRPRNPSHLSGNSRARRPNVQVHCRAVRIRHRAGGSCPRWWSSR